MGDELTRAVLTVNIALLSVYTSYCDFPDRSAPFVLRGLSTSAVPAIAPAKRIKKRWSIGPCREQNYEVLCERIARGYAIVFLRRLPTGTEVAFPARKSSTIVKVSRPRRLRDALRHRGGPLRPENRATRDCEAQKSSRKPSKMLLYGNLCLDNFNS